LTQADTFSVRFYGSIVPTTTASYRLWTNSDDGVILWWYSGGTWQKLIDNPNTYVGQAYTNYFTLTAGQRYPIVLDYFEIGGNANIQLQWQVSTSSSVVTIPQANLSTSIAANLPPLPSGSGGCLGGAPPPQQTSLPFLGPLCDPNVGLRVEVHNNTTLSDPQFVSGSTNRISSNFGAGAPIAGFPADNFSLRFYGSITFAQVNQLYTLQTTSDDGVILWIYNNNVWQKLIDFPYENAGTKSATFTPTAQTYSIALDYFEYTGNANIELSWKVPGSTTYVIVDGLMPNFTSTSVPPPPRPYRIRFATTANNVAGSSTVTDWDLTERSTSIRNGVEKTGLAFQALRNAAGLGIDYPENIFNRVILPSDGVNFLYFISADTTTGLLGEGGPEPDVRVTYTDQQGQLQTVTYPDINNGNCKAFIRASGVTPVRPSAIICNGPLTVSEFTVVHELGHQFDERVGRALSNGIDGSFSLSSCLTIEFNSYYRVLGFGNQGWQRGARGWGSGPYPSDFQKSPENTAFETAADMFLNWVYRRLSPTGATPNIQVNTNGAAASAGPGCIPLSQQGGTFPTQSWNGFLNINWTVPTTPVNDWGLPGDVRQAYMNQRMPQLFQPGW
jgi:hypothetical protein